MDDIFGLFWAVLLIIIGIASSSSKKKKASTARFPLEETPDDSDLASTAPAQPVKAQPKVSPARALRTPPPAVKSPHRVMEPTVHVHETPHCQTHDAPGSLGEGSTEGRDPCHEEQLADMRQAQFSYAATAETPGLALEWSGDNMVKAVIMQEVLTRPSQRRRRL